MLIAILFDMIVLLPFVVKTGQPNLKAPVEKRELLVSKSYLTGVNVTALTRRTFRRNNQLTRGGITTSAIALLYHHEKVK